MDRRMKGNIFKKKERWRVGISWRIVLGLRLCTPLGPVFNPVDPSSHSLELSAGWELIQHALPQCLQIRPCVFIDSEVAQCQKAVQEIWPGTSVLSMNGHHQTAVCT